MSDELVIEGVSYVSSKRAAELSGYAQDYIGQLCRGSMVNAQRIGGLWYVSMDSLNSYKATGNDAASTSSPGNTQAGQEVDSFLNFDGKDYISASRAAKITGYHQDYVGQLARSGKILSRQIGNRWFVDRDGLTAHKQQKDSLLAAVQSQAVGIEKTPFNAAPSAHLQHEYPEYTYTRESGELLPHVYAQKEEKLETAKRNDYSYVHEDQNNENQDEQYEYHADRDDDTHAQYRYLKRARITMFYWIFGLCLSSVVLYFGLRPVASVVEDVLAKYSEKAATKNADTGVFGRVGGVVERLIVPELYYRRFDADF